MGKLKALESANKQQKTGGKIHVIDGQVNLSRAALANDLFAGNR